MLVRFWGVRGSVACPGPGTARYGGNTACVEVRCGDRLLVFDAGTGLRLLGNSLARTEAGKIDQSMAELRKIPPNAGSYVAETNFFESDWQRSFWGTNYPRLQAVKAKYDPDGLFFVHHGVGSEDWSDDGFTRLPK